MHVLKAINLYFFSQSFCYVFLGAKETDHDSFDSDDDEEDDSFRFSLDDKDDDLPHNEPLHLIPLPSTTTSKKRVSKPKQKTPVPERLRFTTDRGEGKVEDQQLDLRYIKY
ncbi:unnamed protein product [Rotaria socialis]